MTDHAKELRDIHPATIITVEGRRVVKEAADEIVRLRAALREIAGQNLSIELTPDEKQRGDFEDGFDMCVETARKALSVSDTKESK